MAGRNILTNSASESVSDQDPRVTGEFLRRLPEARGPLTLVGVVHDHPASIYRVRALSEAVEPDILALELPPLAVPLFEQAASDEATSADVSGEMSAALRAAPTARTVGIDGPSGEYLRALAKNCLHDEPSAGTLGDVVSRTAAASKQALTYRLAAACSKYSSLAPSVDTGTDHGVDESDSPEKQAEDERRQVRRARAFNSAVGGQTRRATGLLHRTREQHMADRLGSLCEEGAVLGVVGIDHLDAIVDNLGTGNHSA